MALRLKDMHDVRRYMAQVINAVRNGDMKAEEASKIGYLLNIMTKIVHLCWEQGQMQKIEERLAALEGRFQLQED
jgi:hypothetical protein